MKVVIPNIKALSWASSWITFYIFIVSSSCGSNNGGCEQLCFNKIPSGTSCACQLGLKLTNDSKLCEDAFKDGRSLISTDSKTSRTNLAFFYIISFTSIITYQSYKQFYNFDRSKSKSLYIVQTRKYSCGNIYARDFSHCTDCPSVEPKALQRKQKFLPGIISLFGYIEKHHVTKLGNNILATVWRRIIDAMIVNQMDI